MQSAAKNKDNAKKYQVIWLWNNRDRPKDVHTQMGQSVLFYYKNKSAKCTTKQNFPIKLTKQKSWKFVFGIIKIQPICDISGIRTEF
jgi:hypothetical protein